MPHLICYDISSNTRRSRLSQKIRAAGFERINKSVYLGTVPAGVLTKLVKELEQDMQQAEPGDSLIILPATASQIERMTVLGTDALDREDLKGDRHTLYF